MGAGWDEPLSAVSERLTETGNEEIGAWRGAAESMPAARHVRELEAMDRNVTLIEPASQAFKNRGCHRRASAMREHEVLAAGDGSRREPRDGWDFVRQHPESLRRPFRALGVKTAARDRLNASRIFAGLRVMVS